MHRLPAARGNIERPLRRSARRCWGFSPVLIALLLPQAVLAMAADEWLARMDAALRGTDYQGTLIYIDGERMDMMRIFHSAATDTERLVTLSGPHREVIRQGRNVTCIGLGRPAQTRGSRGA